MPEIIFNHATAMDALKEGPEDINVHRWGGGALTFIRKVVDSDPIGDTILGDIQV